MKSKFLFFYTTISLFFFLSGCANLNVTKNGYHQTLKYKVKSPKRFSLFNRLDENKSLSQSQQKHDYLNSSSIITPPNLLASKVLNQKSSNTPKSLSLTHETRDIPIRRDADTFVNHPSISLRQHMMREHEDAIELKLSTNDSPRVHWAAIVGLSTGILSFFIFGLLFSICAIVFSAIALSAIRKAPDEYSGKGMAIAGLILGIVALVLTIALIGLYLAL